MKRRNLIGVIAIAAVAVLAWLVVPLGGEPAVASLPETATLDDYGTYITGPAPLNLRLMALEKLRKKSDSGVVAQLDAIAKGDDKRIAIYATTALGKVKTTAAKAKLKALLESTSVDMNVRIGALSALAQHWRSSSDRSYLEDRCEGSSRLAARLAWIEEHVYED